MQAHRGRRTPPHLEQTGRRDTECPSRLEPAKHCITIEVKTYVLYVLYIPYVLYVHGMFTACQINSHYSHAALHETGKLPCCFRLSIVRLSNLSQVTACCID